MPETGPKAGVYSAIEGLKGAAKEVAGKVAGKDDLAAEGEAQQDKAKAERDVAEHEAKAEAARVEAAGHEADERAHQ